MDVFGRSAHPLAGLAVLVSLLAVTLPSPAAAETFVAFGPEVYLRATGQPVTVVTPFTVSDPEAVFTLEILNGGDDDDLARVSSAVISVNGTVIVGPEDFSQQVRRIEKEIELEADNELAVELRSQPGSGLVIRIFGEGDGPLGAGAPVLDPHPNATAEPQIVLTGRAPAAAAVEVSAPTGVVFADLSGDVFSVTVALRPNSDNAIFLTALAADGTRSAPAATTVTQDSQPPDLFIDFPADSAQLTTAATDVAGRVSDLLSGFMGLTVTVNGIPAVVDIGIGTNGTFFVPQLPLALGQQTIIEAVATDALGNTRTTQIAVIQIVIPPGAPRIEVVAGNGQEGQVDSLLGQPIAVRVTQGDGTPFVNKLVTFDVTRSNGRLTADGLGDGAMMLQVRTDAAGEARAFWRLGSDAGCGNNRVEVTSRDVVGTTFFCATALAAPAVQINVGSGNNQRGEAGGPLPDPLVVWVSDGRNPAVGVPVTFTVTRGGGRIGGAVQTTVASGPTGHAAVPFTLGLTPGNQSVTASFPGNPNAAVTFVAFAVARGTGPTSFEGLVIDNGNRPVEGAEVTLQVNGQSLPPIFSDQAGQFAFTGVPAGPAKLFVNGLVATGLGGVPIPPGSFPQLNFDLTLVPDAVNSLPRPVLLPPLDPTNAVGFDNTTDVELTVEGIEGLSLRVRAGSMTRADGTVPSPADPTILSLNQVHFDDVPMPMPDGAAPPFAWTLQPAGAHFDPPIQITYPNMSGLPPGAIAYFLSFNHETNEFEIVASGSVDDSGLSIVSDPGSGLSVSGWGCNCPPYSVTGECCSCAACEECVDGECVQKQGVECCDGVEYDPAVQGCCDDQLYDLETEGCCERPIFSDRVYEKETLCCENGFLSQKHPITFTDWTNPLTCQNPVPTTHSSQANPGPGGTWRFEYDGCSNPISTIRACNDASTTPGALCVFDNNRCSAGSTNAGDPCGSDADCMGGTCESQSCPGGECIFTSMDKDNPAAGDHTAFSGVPPGTGQPNHTRPSPFLACDGHDECYQTCNSDRAVCDNGMLTGMLAACNSAAAAGDPAWIVDRCLFAADAYFKVLRAAGGIAGWGPRQREVCDCCDNN